MGILGVKNTLFDPLFTPFWTPFGVYFGKRAQNQQNCVFLEIDLGVRHTKENRILIRQD